MHPWATTRYAPSTLAMQHLADLFVDVNKQLPPRFLTSQKAIDLAHLLHTGHVHEANTLLMCLPSNHCHHLANRCKHVLIKQNHNIVCVAK